MPVYLLPSFLPLPSSLHTSSQFSTHPVLDLMMTWLNILRMSVTFIWPTVELKVNLFHEIIYNPRVDYLLREFVCFMH